MFKFLDRQKIVIFSTFVITMLISGIFIIYENIIPTMPDFSRQNIKQKNTTISAAEKASDLKVGNPSSISKPVSKIVDKPIQSIQPSQSSTAQNFNSQTVLVSLVLGGISFTESVPEGSSVYDLMKILNDKKITFFKGNNYAGIGYFVEEINGLANNPQTEMYWIYYINGKSATIGISDYIIKPNDTITWKYEKSIF